MRFATALIAALPIALAGATLPGPARAQDPTLATPRALPDKPWPQACPEFFAPVCAKKEGRPKSYVNECRARMDEATDIKPGLCSPGQ